MIAPYDIIWNGALYAAGETIPAREKKLIASLTAVNEDPIEEPETPAKKGK
jgi:hypothetical protein